MSATGISERRLNYFFQTVDAGSMRAAAERLGIEPSVISRQIQQLESDLGAVLLERRGRGVQPTEAGLCVMELCAQRRVGEATLRVQLGELHGLDRGQLHVVVGDGFIEDMMEDVINEFCRLYPRVELTLDSVKASEAVRMIAEDKAHLGIALCPPVHPAVRVMAERAQPLHVIVSSGHPLAELAAPLSLRDVAEYPVVLASPGTGLRSLVHLAELSEKISFRPSFTTNGIQTIRHFLHGTTGVTFLSTHSIATDLREGKLIARRTTNPVFENATGQLLVRSERYVSNALQRLVGIILQHKGFMQSV